MLTNVIAYLHTTLAYQSAAMQLMVGQANVEARQLHLREPLPITVPADTNAWRVAMPPDGVTGGFDTSNYVYHFDAGKLVSIQIKTQPRAEAAKPSLIDTNGALQLARQWLAALSVDVPALEKVDPPEVIQYSSGRRTAVNHERERGRPTDRTSLGERPRPRERPGATNSMPVNLTNSVKLSLFRVTWGDPATGPNRKHLQAIVEILGTTGQCVGFRIFHPELLTRPPLQVTNAASLLGPPPAPEQFVESFLGGPAAYATVAHPDRVLAWLTDGTDAQAARSTAFVLDAAAAAPLSRALTSFDTYEWLHDKACVPAYGVRLRFSKGADLVDLAWSYDCDHLEVTHNGQSADKDCEAAHPVLVRILQSTFPNDPVVRTFKLFNANPTQ